MRFKITFQLLGEKRLLPLSYKYELSAWIYKQIEKANSPFAEFLHTKGYVSQGKRFKLFTFSDLYISRYEIIGDRMKILSWELSFVTSFFVDKAAESLIMGLFQEERFLLGDKISQVELQVKHIQMLPLNVSGETIKLKTTGPMVISRQPDIEKGEVHAQYLNPTELDFADCFFQNLLSKYEVARTHNLIEKIEISEEPTFHLLRARPKSRMIKIKAHRPDETKIRGFLFEFELKAPKELIHFGMLSGFGVANAMGFGATKIISSKG